MWIQELRGAGLDVRMVDLVHLAGGVSGFDARGWCARGEDIERLLEHVVTVNDVSTLDGRIRSRSSTPPKPKGAEAADRVECFLGALAGYGLPRDAYLHASAAGEAAIRDDVKGAVDAMYKLAACEGWSTLRGADKCAVRTLLVSDAVGVFPSVAMATIGQYSPCAGWQEPKDAPHDGADDENLGVELGASMADVKAAPVTARGLGFGGTIGFIRGPKSSGKTTVLAAAAARVTRGEDFAGQPTEAGFVLIVRDDDPRSWQIRMRQYGADPERWGAIRARDAVRRRLPALIDKFRPAWIIIDNLRTWCGALDLSVDSSTEAAAGIDPVAGAMREAGYPLAVTITHNEARSKDHDGYSGRMRNSTVFEDAADWIVACAHDDGTTQTYITAGDKDAGRHPD